MDTHQATTPDAPEQAREQLREQARDQLGDQLRVRLPEHAAHLGGEPELVAASDQQGQRHVETLAGAHPTNAVSDPLDKIGGMDTHQARTPVAPEQAREQLRDQAPDQLRVRLPEHAAHLAGEPELVAAWDHELTERRAQAAKVQSLLAYKTRKLEANEGQHTFTRRAAEKAITRDAATTLGLTEATVRRLLTTAEFLTEKLPKTWETYRTGAIDRDSAAKAAAAVEDIADREDLLPVLDAEIADRAPDQNAGTVQKWVTTRVAELDAAGFQERYDRAQGKRYVTFRHLGNGMSRIEALIPTLVAAQIEQQLHTDSRNAPRNTAISTTVGHALSTSSPGSTGHSADHHDPAAQQPTLQERTLTQRIADAFIHRLHTGHSGHSEPPQAQAAPTGQGPAPGADSTSTSPSTDPGGPSGGSPGLKIGILVPVQTLTGDSDEPALSWDRTWSLPAETTRQIALNPEAEHDWYICGTTETTSTTALATTTGTAAYAAGESFTGVNTPTTASSSGGAGQPATTETTGGGAASASTAASTTDGGASTTTASAVPEILTVVHPRKGPSDQSLADWISATNPAEGNLLAKTYQSRTARDRQRDAILIRDGQCTQIGCSNPGWQAEIDHTRSYETGGHTTGDNLKVLCRDCHSIKSHQLDGNSRSGSRNSPTTPARASPALGAPVNTPATANPDDDDLPAWLIETRPPPDWATPDAA